MRATDRVTFDLPVSAEADVLVAGGGPTGVAAALSAGAQNGVMSVFGDAATVEDAATRVLEAIGTSLQWPLGNFWIVDGSVVRWVAGWQAPGSDLDEFVAVSSGMTFTAGVGLPGRVWAATEAAWIVDVGRDLNFPRLDVAVRTGLRGAFAFPVLTRDAVVGVDWTTTIYPLDANFDPDGDPLSVSIDSGPSKGFLIPNRDGSFVYEPNNGASGWDTFTESPDWTSGL